MKSLLLFICLFALAPLLFAADSRKPDDPWVRMGERVRIWDELVARELGLPLPLPQTKPYTISANGLEATFEKEGVKWTIVGANAPIVNPTIYPKDWPVKGDDFEVLVIPEPITNYKILPFTEKIENALKSDTITIIAAPDSYEPASFVIRSGDMDLKDVMVELTDLKAQSKGKGGKLTAALIPKENVDVTAVKCWYQAGVAISDTRHKLLTPELLLHDDDVVRVDYDRQVNLLRNLEEIQDAEKLRSFNIPAHQNKQIWLTAHVKDKFLPGKYTGSVQIFVNKEKKDELKLEIQVLPFTLPKPMLEYALYYEGHLSDGKKPQIGWRPKTETQMLYELEDMKEHGLTNATVWHQVNKDTTKWDEDWMRLKRTLELRKQIGWGTKPLLYLDWHAIFKEDLYIYKKKIESLVKVAKGFGISDVYVYGVDERRGKELLALRSLYKTVHEAGAKNFVACVEDFIIFIPDLLDLPVLPGEPNIFFMRLLKKLGIAPWNYANPQTGLEEPETYRNNYGVKLLKNAFSGVCDYVYQHGSCWNDFESLTYRSHTMAYPTISKPISTIQWEGWREGVNDVRYLTLLKSKQLINDEWLKQRCEEMTKPCWEKIREFLVQKHL